MSNNSSNKLNVPQAKQGMEQFKMQAANEVGMNLKNGCGTCTEGGVHSYNHYLIFK